MKAVCVLHLCFCVHCLQRSKEAYETNPFGKVPTLIDGDFSIYESVAINTYLGDKFRTDEMELVPAPGTTARGRYEQLVATIYGELDCQSLWIHRKHKSEVSKWLGGPNHAAVDVAKKWFDQVMDVLAAELAHATSTSGGDFLLGKHFSAADVLFVHCLGWAEAIGWGERWTSDAPELVGIAHYLDVCRARPAFLRTQEIAARDTKKPPRLRL